MYNSKYYTCEQIDQRLLDGYYDDAVAAGYTDTKAQYLAGLLKAINYSANPTLVAEKVIYNPSASGLSSKNVKAALDKLSEEIIQVGVYDVSAHNNNAVFESLQALLSSSNLSTLIPPSVRHGGMSIKFIQGSVPSSDNKYVQFRCMAQNFTTDVTQWQGVDDEPVAGSDNLVKSGAVAEFNRIPFVSDNSYVNKNIDSVISIATYSGKCVLVTAFEGQVFIVKGASADSFRLWATLDEDKKVIRCSSYISGVNTEEVTIGSTEKYICFNTSTSELENSYIYLSSGNLVGYTLNRICEIEDIAASTKSTVTTLSNKTTLLENKQNEILNVTLIDGYVVCNTIGSPINIQSSESYKYRLIKVEAGQKFTVTGVPTVYSRLWATLDADRKVLRCSEYTDSKHTEEVTIVSGEYYLVYNTSNISTKKVFKLTEGNLVGYVGSNLYNLYQKDVVHDAAISSLEGAVERNLNLSDAFSSDTVFASNGNYIVETTKISGYVGQVIRVYAGMKFLLTLRGGSGQLAYYTTDSYRLIKRQAASAVLNDYELTIEAGEEYLFLSSNTAPVTPGGELFEPKVELYSDLAYISTSNTALVKDTSEKIDCICEYYPVLSSVLPEGYTDSSSNFWSLGSLGNDWYVGGSTISIINARPIRLEKGKYLLSIKGSNQRYAIYDKHFNRKTIGVINRTLIDVTDDFVYLYVNPLISNLASLILIRLTLSYKNTILNTDDRRVIDGVNSVSKGYIDGHSVLNDTTFTNSDYTSTAYGYSTPFIPIKKGAKIDVFMWSTTSPNAVHQVAIYKDSKIVGSVYLSNVGIEGSGVTYTGAIHSNASEYKVHLPYDTFDSDGMSIKIFTADVYAKVPSMRICTYESSFVMDDSSIVKGVLSLGDFTNSISKTIPIIVEGTAGLPNAKYTIAAHLLDENRFNIRFKFRITENIINGAIAQAPSWSANTPYAAGDYVWYSGISYKCVVAHTSSSSFATANFERVYINIFQGFNAVIMATPSQGLSQYTQTYTYQDNTYTSYYGTFNGGVKFDNIANINNRKFLNNIGDFAFSVRYTGNGSSATAQNTGSAFILKVDGTQVASLDYETYDTVDKLYKAIAAVSGFEVGYNEVEDRTPQELAIFPESQLISTFYGDITGKKPGAEGAVVEQYTDNPPLLIPYAICNRWNQAEIVGIDGMVYVAVNGITSSYTMTPASNIVFGGDCGVLFKDVEIDTNGVRDAEIATNYGSNASMIVSSVTPYCMIYEGHGMVDSITDAVNYPGDEMSCSADRIQRIVEYSIAMGYVPVSLMDIVEHYKYGKSVPKKCFTFIFDDYRFSNFLNLKNRSVFTRFNLKAALAVISNQVDDITYNGNNISIEKAVSIGKNAGFECYSHTRNHRYMEGIRPSEYAAQAILDIYDGDEKGINPNILIFPYGDSNTYLLDILKFIGLEAGIDVEVGNPYCNNPYCLVRQEIGVRVTIESILSKIV